MYILAHAYINAVVHSYIHTYIHTCMHTYIHNIYVHINVHQMYIHIYIYARTYMRARTYKASTEPITHPRICNLLCSFSRTGIVMAHFTSSQPFFAFYEIPFITMIVPDFVHLCILYLCHYTPDRIHRVATPTVVSSSHHITSHHTITSHHQITPYHVIPTSHHITLCHTAPYHRVSNHFITVSHQHNTARCSTAHITVLTTLSSTPPLTPTYAHACTRTYSQLALICVYAKHFI